MSSPPGRNLLVVLSIIVVAPGCSLFGSSKLEGCRAESERLLADYREQRDRADRLAAQNRAMTDRVVDLEQRLAVIQNSADQRLATRPERRPLESSSQPSGSFIGPPMPSNQSALPSSRAVVPPPDPWKAVPR